MPPMSVARVSSRLRRATVAVATVAAALSVPMITSAPAHATVGSDPFIAGRVYHGEFGAPSLIRVGTTYYAFGTNLGNRNLPALSSHDLRTWRARAAYPESAHMSTWKGFNDAFPYPPNWPIHSRDGEGHIRISLWAPSVAQVGSSFVLAYAVPVSATKRCISIATSAHVMGPYRDRSTGPIVCSSEPMGSIDPQIFVVKPGMQYLVWKNSGVPGKSPTKFWTRRLNSTGTGFYVHSRPHFLLATKQRWEGSVIEAPAMISYAHHYYLFYSGNGYKTPRYATGYAICRTAIGPCYRQTRGPLLATGGKVAGPGAASPIIDLHGRLRLAYSAWRIGHVGYPSSTACRRTAAGCNQRRMYIATLAVAGPKGRLHVTSRG